MGSKALPALTDSSCPPMLVSSLCLVPSAVPLVFDPITRPKLWMMASLKVLAKFLSFLDAILKIEGL